MLLHVLCCAVTSGESQILALMSSLCGIAWLFCGIFSLTPQIAHYARSQKPK